MSWTNFIEYVLMKEMGQEDTIMRNYAVGPKLNKKTQSYVGYAPDDFGLPQHPSERQSILDMITAMLRNTGMTPPPIDTLEQWFNEYHIWNALKMGKIRNWTKRYGKQSNTHELPTPAPPESSGGKYSAVYGSLL